MLYVPIAQLDCVGKYVCDDNAKPKINTLGSKEWTKTKTKVKAHVKEIAKELIVCVHTAKAHVRSILQKMCVNDRVQAALKAVKEGMV